MWKIQLLLIGGEKMETLFEKISSYNFLNNLLPGAVFCYLLKYFTLINLIGEELIGNLFFYYFCGMVISRIGSIIVEPLFKKVKIVTFAEYKSFLKASEVDIKIDTLSETNNTYRTFIALFLIIGSLKMYIYISNFCNVPNSIGTILLLVGLLLLFSISYRKQVSYITKRVDNACNSNQNQETGI